MSSILAFILLICTFLGELVGAAVGLAERLPALDDETMQATFGASRYHSEAMRGNIGIFHATGDEWTTTRLKEYFLTGIFQHYVHELCGLDMTFDYEIRAELVSPEVYGEKLKCLSKAVLDVDDEALGYDVAKLFNIILSGIKSNHTFVGLGICFHRNKVNQEKLETRLEELKRVISEKHRKREQVIQSKFDEMMAIDRKAMDQQIAFYYWMKETLRDAVNYIKTTYEASGALLALDDKDFLVICSHEPEFLTWPVYKELVPLALAEEP